MLRTPKQIQVILFMRIPPSEWYICLCSAEMAKILRTDLPFAFDENGEDKEICIGNQMPADSFLKYPI